MRRSQAPSFRSTIAPLSNTTSSLSSLTSTTDALRSTDAIVNLLSSGTTDVVDENVEPSFVKEKQPFTEPECKPCFEGSLTIFNVVFGKQTKKKHKTWEGDGTLEVGAKLMVLKDEDGKVLGSVPKSKCKELEEGSRLFVGSKEVEVIELATLVVGNSCAAVEKRPLQSSVTVAAPVKRLKLDGIGKKFVVPRHNAADGGLVLPEPSAMHQWEWNKEQLPVTPVCVDGFLARQLRQHQKVGVSFLYECVLGFKGNGVSGAILADEMGLGKTLQCITLIWTLLKQGPYNGKPVVRRVLIVTPSSLTRNWHSEFIKWLGRERLRLLVVDQKTKPAELKPHDSVMIISYEMFLRYSEDVMKHNFDLVICDEGHRLKNSSIRTTQLLNQLPCDRRVLLTGTPIQNDLQELYALVDFVNPNALGSASEFRRNFEQPILNSRQPLADDETVAVGEESAAELNKRTSLFLLRRTHEVLDKYLPTKHEVVVFVEPSQEQVQAYNSLVCTESALGCGDGAAHLALICALKKVCNHPLLAREDAATESFSAELVGQSSKLAVTACLLSALSLPREKIVLVSNSTQTLDLLARVCAGLELKTCRLDGSTPAHLRQAVVDKFNTYGTESVFLLSARAGGVGLNLTGASKLVLYDSDWNPATDLQAMSRVWRDGQKRSVCIYRLVTCGTIEEKIYQRQLNKQGLCDGTVDPHTARSIKLSQDELKDLFSECEVGQGCKTHSLLCECSGDGSVPLGTAPETDDRPCQLTLDGAAEASLKMNELLHWQHHAPPLHPQLLADLNLTNCQHLVSFVFRNSVLQPN